MYVYIKEIIVNIVANTHDSLVSNLYILKFSSDNPARVPLHNYAKLMLMASGKFSIYTQHLRKFKFIGSFCGVVRGWCRDA